MRKYTNHSPHEILTDVAIHGKSEGWSGSRQELEAWSAILNKFNVYYVDDFNGTWKRRPDVSEKLIQFAQVFPQATKELNEAMENHLAALLKIKDRHIHGTFMEICEKYKAVADTVNLFI